MDKITTGGREEEGSDVMIRERKKRRKKKKERKTVDVKIYSRSKYSKSESIIKSQYSHRDVIITTK